MEKLHTYKELYELQKLPLEKSSKPRSKRRALTAIDNDKARRAFQNYVLDQLEDYENHTKYFEDWSEGICDCCTVCKGVGACGTDLCIDTLIEFYGGEGYEDN